MQENGKICAVGSADGSTTILQMSDGLMNPHPTEKRAVGAVSPPSPQSLPPASAYDATCVDFLASSTLMA